MTEIIIVGSAMLFVSVIIGLLMKKNIDLSVEKRSLIEEKKRRKAARKGANAIEKDVADTEPDKLRKRLRKRKKRSD